MSLLYSYNLLCVYSFDFPEVNNSHICWQLSDTEICCTQSISFGAQHRSFQMSLTKCWHDFFCSSQNMSNFFLSHLFINYYNASKPALIFALTPVPFSIINSLDIHEFVSGMPSGEYYIMCQGV